MHLHNTYLDGRMPVRSASTLNLTDEEYGNLKLLYAATDEYWSRFESSANDSEDNTNIRNMLHEFRKLGYAFDHYDSVGSTAILMTQDMVYILTAKRVMGDAAGQHVLRDGKIEALRKKLASSFITKDPEAE